MAAGAIRAVSRCSPGGGLGVALVACYAKRVAAVITRVFGRGVSEINGQPAGRVVAGVALQAGAEVSGRFAGRLCTVVAGRAGTGDAAVIETGG